MILTGTKAKAIFGDRCGPDGEAPMHGGALDYEPCDECKRWMAQGVILISVRDAKGDDPKNPYRTGGWCVVREDVIRRIVTPPELVEDILKRRVCFVPDDVWDKVGLPRETGGADATTPAR